MQEEEGKAVLEPGPLVWHRPPMVPASAAQRAEAIRASLTSKTTATATATATPSSSSPSPTAATAGVSGGAARGSGGGWLSGVKVLDLCNVIAGPVIGGTLARFGADVIKLDPSRPTPKPQNPKIMNRFYFNFQSINQWLSYEYFK